MTMTLLRFENPKAQNFSGIIMIPFFNPENFLLINEYYSSIMTGEDSANADDKSIEYGRSTPPPTTSYSSKKQDYGDAKSAAEPDKEDKEKNKEDKEEIDLQRPDANPGYKPEEKSDENKISRDNRDDSGRDREEKEKSCKKLDGSDKLDGQWIPAKDTKPEADDDDDYDSDDNCTVKCLYYTLQCCECTIS